MEYRLPKNYLGGHVSSFPMLDQDANPEEFSGNLFVPREPDSTLRFSAMRMPPHSLVIADKNVSFTAYGPLFSIAFEAAKKINYSMIGDYLDGASANEIMLRAFSFVPDLVLAPAAPTLTNVMQAIQVGMLEFTGLVGVFEMDHILSKKQFKMDFQRILYVLSGKIWTAIFFSLALVFSKTLLAKIVQEKLMSATKSYPKPSNIIFFLSVCFFGNPMIPASQTHSWRLTACFWMIATLFLKFLISGDLVTVMTLGPQLDPIDSFLDLAIKNPNTKITAFASTVNDMDSVRKNYFSKHIYEHEQLNNRLHLLEIENMNDNEIVGEMLREVASGERYHLGFAMTLRYNINNWFDGNFSDSVYISKDYIHFMPGFMTAFSLYHPKLKWSIRVTRDQLWESGIYNRWLDYFIGESKAVKEGLSDNDSITELKESVIFFIILLFGLGIATIVWLLELAYRKLIAREKVLPTLEDEFEITEEEIQKMEEQIEKLISKHCNTNAFEITPKNNENTATSPSGLKEENNHKIETNLRTHNGTKEKWNKVKQVVEKAQNGKRDSLDNLLNALSMTEINS